MGYKLKNKNLGAFKSSIKLYLIIFFITVSITMYYDEEHSKLFTAFNHQVIKELACLFENISLNGKLLSLLLWYVEKGFRPSMVANLQPSRQLDPGVYLSSNMAAAGRVAFHSSKVLISFFNKLLPFLDDKKIALLEK